MSKNIKVTVRKATKVSAQEAKKLGRATMGLARPTPPKSGSVEAQARVSNRVECPYCRGISWCDLDSDVYLWFECCHCHNYFRM